MKKANVAAEDKRIEDAVIERDAICQRMAAGELSLMPELLDVTERITRAKWDRSEKIRDTFLRKG